MTHEGHCCDFARAIFYICPENHFDTNLTCLEQAVHWENFAAFLALFKQLERLDLYNVKFISDEDTSLRTWGDGYQHLLTENVFQGMQLKVCLTILSFHIQMFFP